MTVIGSSDLDVFPLGLGGNTFGWTSDKDTSFAVLDAYVAGGGNFIDTADGYSAWVPGNVGGESETIIGEWTAARGNRDSVIVATKVFSHPQFRGLSPKNVLAAADASLARLQTDRIDLYFVHRDDPDVPVAEAAGAFHELLLAGKIRHVGLSNFTAPRLREWFAVSAAEGFAAPVALVFHNPVWKTSRRVVDRLWINCPWITRRRCRSSDLAQIIAQSLAELKSVAAAG